MSKRRDFDAVFKRFGKNLRISDEQNSALIGARRIVRKHLRQHCPKESGIKFLTQGSYAYGTLNRPSRVPPQRMDLDDGAYFTAPDTGVRELFEWADNALQGLVDIHQGWRLDASKPSCCRVIIPVDMHVDVPLYASMNESPDNLRAHRERYAPLYQEAGMFYAPLSGVWLAHRNDGWIKSDPGALIDWVLECRQKYGKQYLSVCRYFKAWRDHQWDESPLKSILIMRMVDLAFQSDAEMLDTDGDDVSIMRVAGRMLDSLGNGNITDPTDDSKMLDKGILSNERANIIEKLKALHIGMESALYDGNTSEYGACEFMRLQFGKWFPKDAGSISAGGKIPAAVATAAISKPDRVAAARPWARK